jgi:hypothetical protein
MTQPETSPLTQAQDARQRDKVEFEISKLQEDIANAKLSRSTTIVATVATCLNVLVIGSTAFVIYLMIQRPTVDLAKEDSDRRMRIELIKMLIEVEKSKDIEDRQNIIEFIKFYLADAFNTEMREKVTALLPGEKNYGSGGRTTSIAPKEACLLSSGAIEIDNLRRNIMEAKLLMHAEEVGSGSGKAGRGPNWFRLNQTLKQLEARQYDIMAGLSPECQAAVKDQQSKSGE